MSIGHAEWIGNFSLGHRLWETGLTFMVGETGDIIARPEHPLLALILPCLLVAALRCSSSPAASVPSAAPPRSRWRSPR